jgi:hypothetical protein
VKLIKDEINSIGTYVKSPQPGDLLAVSVAWLPEPKIRMCLCVRGVLPKSSLRIIKVLIDSRVTAVYNSDARLIQSK